MKDTFKNIGLLLLVAIASLFSASYFGSLYDLFLPVYDNTLGLGNDILVFVIGFPLAFIFISIFIFKLYGFGNKDKWVLILFLITITFLALIDIKHIYFPLIISLISFLSANLLTKIFNFKKN